MFYEKWMDLANCIGVDTESFFIRLSSSTMRTDRYRIETAFEICSECPVKAQCYEFGDRNEFVGIFGGVYRKPGE